MKYKWSCGPIQTKPASRFCIGAPIGSNLWRSLAVGLILIPLSIHNCPTIRRPNLLHSFHFLFHIFCIFLSYLSPLGKYFWQLHLWEETGAQKWMLLSKVQYNKRQNAKLQFSRNFLRCKKLLIKSPPKWRKYRNVSLNLGPEYIAPLDFLNKQLG